MPVGVLSVVLRKSAATCIKVAFTVTNCQFMSLSLVYVCELETLQWKLGEIPLYIIATDAEGQLFNVFG